MTAGADAGADGGERWRCAVDRAIAAVDARIAAQLDAVLHHPRLQRLEAAWRGLAWLVGGLEPGGAVKVKLLAVSWPELCRDLERAGEFDQSRLFRKVYEEEFGSPGGEPFGLLVVDHEVRHRPSPEAPADDLGALTALAGVAAAAFAPTVLAASPALLQADGFADLAMAGDLSPPFRGAEYARWRTLGGREDMRFIALAVPRLLARPPWGDDAARCDGLGYREHAPGPAERVWMNAGYAFAACAARAFARYGWPADVRGSDTDRLGGGLVHGAPAEPFPTDPGWPRCPLEIAFSDQQERVLAEAGLMPLSALPFGAEAVFACVGSLQVPARYDGAAAEANARVSAQFNAMLCASRFAHAIKVMGRDMVGAARTAGEIEQRLHDWLQDHVNSNPATGSDARARYPLLAAAVEVRERPGRPGVFGCTVLLQPHHQLDDVTAGFRLATELAAPVRQ